MPEYTIHAPGTVVFKTITDTEVDAMQIFRQWERLASGAAFPPYEHGPRGAQVTGRAAVTILPGAEIVNIERPEDPTEKEPEND